MLSIFISSKSIACNENAEFSCNLETNGGNKAQLSQISLSDDPSQEVPASENNQSLNTRGLTDGVEGFDGLDNDDGFDNPAVQGDVSASHYIQVVNNRFAVFDREGKLLSSPKPIRKLWEGFTGPCRSDTGKGGVSVLYDDMADRWLLAFQTKDQSTNKYVQCLALTRTSDPLGAYFLYTFVYPYEYSDALRFSVGEKAYYMSGTRFDSSSSQIKKAYVMAFERAKMLIGETVTTFDFSVDKVLSLSPLKIHGKRRPSLENEKLFILGPDTDKTVFDELVIGRFHVDWVDRSKSNFKVIGNIPVSQWRASYTADQPGNTSLQVPGSSSGAFNFMGLDGRDAISYTHSYSPNRAIQPAIRWYDLSLDENDLSLHQSGEYAPDSQSYWLSNGVFDTQGNLGIGHNVSSKTVFPSIAIAGRLANDPLGSLTQTKTLLDGEGSQSSARWGKYSSNVLDPTDDCTFWISNEYYKAVDDNTNHWSTAIIQFKYPDCQSNYTAELTGLVTEVGTQIPLSDALISIGNTHTRTDDTGRYRISLPEGKYNITASRYGYQNLGTPSFTLQKDSSTERDISMSPSNRVTINGRVRDTQKDKPIYAKITGTGPGGATIVTYTDPVTGKYTMSLTPETFVKMEAESVFDGKDAYQGRENYWASPTEGGTENLNLKVSSACTAMGYQMISGTCTPIGGNFVAGLLKDQHGALVNGAKIKEPVSGNVLGHSYHTDDPNNPDGLLYAFIPNGVTEVEISGEDLVTMVVNVSDISMSKSLVVEKLDGSISGLKDVYIEVPQGEIRAWQVKLKSTAKVDVDFSVTSSPKVDWLSVTPSSGTFTAGGTVLLTLSMNTAIMELGESQTDIVVTVNGQETRAHLTVNVVAGEADQLEMSYKKITIDAGEDIPPLILTRSGTGQTLASVNYRVTMDGEIASEGKLEWPAGDTSGRSMQLSTIAGSATTMVSFYDPVNLKMTSDTVSITTVGGSGSSTGKLPLPQITLADVASQLGASGSLGMLTGCWLLLLLYYRRYRY